MTSSFVSFLTGFDECGAGRDTSPSNKDKALSGSSLIARPGNMSFIFSFSRLCVSVFESKESPVPPTPEARVVPVDVVD